MESFVYRLTNGEVFVVRIALFVNVQNASAIRLQDAYVNFRFAFVDAKLLTSRKQVQTAIYQSLLAHSTHTMKTRSIYSEVIYALNPTNNITEALRRFGISQLTNSVVVIQLGRSDINVDDSFRVAEEMKSIVQGEIRTLDDIARVTDWAAVVKCYKLHESLTSHNVNISSPKGQRLIDQIVTSFTAMKTIAS